MRTCTVHVRLQHIPGSDLFNGSRRHYGCECNFELRRSSGGCRRICLAASPFDDGRQYGMVAAPGPSLLGRRAGLACASPRASLGIASCRPQQLATAHRSFLPIIDQSDPQLFALPQGAELPPCTYMCQLRACAMYFTVTSSQHGLRQYIPN